MGDIGLAGMFAGAWEGLILAAGGSNFPGNPPWKQGKKVWYDDVYACDGESWKLVGKIKEPIALGASVTTPRGVLCIAGGNETAITGRAFFLRFANGRVETEAAPPLPRAVMACSAALVGTRVFVVGGHDEMDPLAKGPVENVWSLDVTRPTEGWRAEPPLPAAPRWLPVTGSDGENLYVLSGLTRANAQTIHCPADAWCYTPLPAGAAGRWKRLPDLPRANAGIPSPVPFVAGRLVLLGGGVDDSNFPYPPELRPAFPTTVRTYDPADGSVEEIGDLPAAPVVAPIVPWRDGYVIISGEVRTRTGVRTPAVWHYRLTPRQ